MGQNGKTLWQRFYSFFGFWTYKDNVLIGSGSQGVWRTYLVVYWCCLPWKFYRKFDVLRVKIEEKSCKEVQRELADLKKRLDS